MNNNTPKLLLPPSSSSPSFDAAPWVMLGLSVGIELGNSVMQPWLNALTIELENISQSQSSDMHPVSSLDDGK